MDPPLFPDAAPRFFALFNDLMHEGSWFARARSLRIVTPLAKLDKAGILRLALRLHVPLEATWSCYERGDQHCGHCHACLTRLEAFRKLRRRDPVAYASA
jgi:7-cyano-7-deazaguanine synthase